MKKLLLFLAPLLLLIGCEREHETPIDKKLIGTWERVSETLYNMQGTTEKSDFVKRTMTFRRNWSVQIREEDNNGTGTYFLGMEAFMEGCGIMRLWEDRYPYLYILTPSGEGELWQYSIISPDTLWTIEAMPPPGGTSAYKYVKIK